MTPRYRILGGENSPDAVKVRAALRFKGLAFGFDSTAADPVRELTVFTGGPARSLVIDAEGTSYSETSEFLDALERAHPQPSLNPSDPENAWLAELLTVYAESWLQRAAIHFRWSNAEDRAAAAARLARAVAPEATPSERQERAALLAEDLAAALPVLGSAPPGDELLERSLHRAVAILDTHLADRPYLLGDAASRADLELSTPLYASGMDLTASRMLRSTGPQVVAWIRRSLDPAVSGRMDSWFALEPTLAPLLVSEVEGCYLPFALANARAVAAGEDSLGTEIDGVAFGCGVDGRAATRWSALGERFRALPEPAALASQLDDAGCGALVEALSSRSSAPGTAPRRAAP